MNKLAQIKELEAAKLKSKSQLDTIKDKKKLTKAEKKELKRQQKDIVMQAENEAGEEQKKHDRFTVGVFF